MKFENFKEIPKKEINRIEELTIRNDGGDLAVIANVNRKPELSQEEKNELDDLIERQPERSKEELLELLNLYNEYKNGDNKNLERLKELYYGRKPRTHLESSDNGDADEDNG